MRQRNSATWVAILGLAAAASPAFAQDYTVTNPQNIYQSPPAASTQISVSNNQTVVVQMPFTFPYYGQGYSTCYVCSEGYIQFQTGGTVVAANAVFPRSGTSDGIVAVYWDDMAMNVSGAVRQWVNGVAPNREWVVSWENMALAAQTTARISFQVRLTEDTGRIEFAYKPLAQQSTWLASTYTPGLDAAATGDNRFTTPPGMNVISNTGHPPTDYRFDPFVKQFTGTLLYDRVVADATGYGNSVQANIPLSNVRVELRAQNGSFAGTGTTDDTGFFTVNGAALLAATSGSLNVVAQSPAARVATLPFGAAITRTVLTGLPLSSGRDVGVLTLPQSLDPGDQFLPALHMASTAGAALKALQPLSATPIGTLDMVYDSSSSLATQFTPPSSPNGALLRIGGALSPNPDQWDTDVVIKAFAAGQVLGTLTVYPPASLTQFDAISTPENAFAEGFGYAMFMAVTGRSSFVDATSTSTANVFDLESPSLATRKGPDVAGWLAAALCDLVDGPNELQDSIDGTQKPGESVVRVTDAITAAPTSVNFHAAWGGAGYSGAGLTRNFVFHGVLLDDPDEFNNASDEVAVLGAAGVRRTALVLNQYDEDWYSVTIDAPTDSIGADVEYDRKVLTTVSVALEIRDAGGAVIATGVPGAGYLPISAISAPVPAGTYRVRVSHTGGPRLDVYNLQVYRRMQVATSFPAGWTVNRPMLVPISVAGGVPPYTLRIEEPFIQPPGLIFDAVNGLARGAPTLAGPYGFIITAFDTGTPKHDGSAIVQRFTVNEELALDFRDVVGISIGRTNDQLLARTGGTTPFDFDVTGDLPPGVAISATELRLTGTVAGQGVWRVHMDGADLAGSPAQGDTSIVACSPPSDGVSTMHADAAATAVGFAFDALEGSRVSVAVKTQKGGAKRNLVAHVVTAGGAPLEGHIAGGTGKAAADGLLCPVSGRYYVILETGPGGATDLLGSVHITPPRSGRSGVERFSPSDTVDVPIGALQGALLTFSASSGAKSNLKVVPIGLIRPDGVPISLAGIVQQKPSSFKLTSPLGRSGTWIVRLGAISGVPGPITWSYSVRQPRGVLYSID